MGPLRFILANFRFLAAGFLLSLTSSYGQTFFISIFAARIMADFGLSAGGWGLAYMAATMSSALVMFWAGTLTDRFRVRALALVVLPGLALTCLWMGVAEGVVSLIGVVFLLRLFGQGLCSQLAVVAMARWFSSRRGLALSVSALGFSVGTALYPVLFAWLLGMIDWRMLWVLAAALVMFVLPLLWWLLGAERMPAALAAEPQSLGMKARHWTRPDVLSHPLFWLLLPMLLAPPTWGTALFFQQVHIADAKGFSLTSYLALLPIMMAVATLATILSGQLIDRWGTARLVRVYLLPWIAGFLILWGATSLWSVALAFAFFGLGQGMQATVPTAFWAEFYGTRHLGAIKAASMSIMVLGSALGPGISGALIDAGVTFPQQMPLVAGFFALAVLLAWLGVARFSRDLPQAGEVDIVGA